MQMEMLENGCLKIMLSEEDLVILGLNFASMEEDNDATRDAIQMLLLAAREETGFAPENGVTVEALPVDGGCLLLFTPSAGHRRVRMKRASGPYIYELEDAEQLFPLADGLCRLGGARKRPLPPMAGSSLYRFDGRYRLVVYPASTLPKGVGQLFAEFARSAGEGDAAAAFTAEHGQAVAVGDALSKLCAALVKVPGSSSPGPAHPPM